MAAWVGNTTYPDAFLNSDASASIYEIKSGPTTFASISLISYSVNILLTFSYPADV